MKDRVYQWEISSHARDQIMGGDSDACMLVAGFHAYSLLPGRIVGDGRMGSRSALAMDGAQSSGQHGRALAPWSSLSGSLMSLQSGNFATPWAQPVSAEANDEGSVQAGPSQDATSGTGAAAGRSNSDEGTADAYARLDSGDGFSSSGAVNEYEYAQEGIRGSSERVPFAHPSVSSYFTGKHFGSVARHGPVAWDDCMWLLLLQERSVTRQRNSSSDEEEGQPRVAPVAQDPSSATSARGATCIYDFFDREMDRLASLHASRLGGRSALGDEARMDGTGAGEQKGTAFGIFENEFVLMKPFLMYNAVVAANMGRMNLYYMQEQCTEYMNDVAVRTGLYPHLAERGRAHADGEKRSSADSDHGDGEGGDASTRKRRRKLF
jgi:hypothetical protein